MKFAMPSAVVACCKIASLSPPPASRTHVSADAGSDRFVITESRPLEGLPGFPDNGVRRNSKDLGSLSDSEGSRFSTLPIPCQRLHTVEVFKGRVRGMSSNTKRCRASAITYSAKTHADRRHQIRPEPL